MDPQQVIADLERLGELVQVRMATDGLPPIADMDPEQSYLAWEIWLLSDRPSAEIDACFEFIGDPAAVQIVALPMGGDAPATEHGGAEHGDAATAHAPAHAEGEGRRAPAAAAAEAASIRVPVEKVDRLINLVGELVITQSMVAQTVARSHREQLPGLQEAVGSDGPPRARAARAGDGRPHDADQDALRALPAARARPHGHDRQAGRAGDGRARTPSSTRPSSRRSAIRSRTSSATPSTTASRRPADRVRAGKPERGIVRLEAYQQGGNIFIEIADDGGGLDRDRILRQGGRRTG